MKALKGVFPLAITIAVLSFVYVILTLNFTFHWLTDGDLGNGLELPKNFHFAVPAGFVAWGFYFAAGAGAEGVKKVSFASLVGATAALGTMWLTGVLAQLPELWGLSLAVGIFAFIVVMFAVAGEGYYVPAVFGAFASTLFWWIATGLDNWAPGGGGVGNSIEALGDPATAGAGAFGGVISTPYGWVYVSVLATLFLGIVFGYLTSVITGAITPTSAAAPADAPSDQA